MDTQTSQPNQNLDEFFATVPKEVEDFMWSEAYEIILRAIKSTLSLTDEQLGVVRTASYELILNMKSMEQVAEELVAAGLSNELIAKVLYAIDSQLISRAANIAEFYAPDPDEDEEGVIASTASTQVAPSPADVLETLKSRLTEAKAVAPIVRKMDIQKDGTQAASLKQSPDPYREQV